MVTRVDCTLHKQTFKDRTESARRLVEATKLDLKLTTSSALTGIDVSREARGLAIVLLFGAYENLLRTVCRTLLETAAKSRAKARSVKPGFRVFLAHNRMESLVDCGLKKVWSTTGVPLATVLEDASMQDLNVSLFPDDGSFMKTSQVSLLCDIFGLGDPGPILREVWRKVNGLVEQRNSIAHGGLTADEVGRAYTHDEMLKLIESWQLRWTDFLSWIETTCNSTKFYLR